MTKVGVNAGWYKAERGFALLIVMWSVALMALLAMRLTSTGRNELQLASNIRNAAVSEAQADGLLYSTILRLMGDTAAQRGVDGLEHVALVPHGHATVRATSLAGKLNPNTSSDVLLRALMEAVGTTPAAADRLAAAIADWRSPGKLARSGMAKAAQYQQAGLDYTPPGTPFESVGELGLVAGMTPALLEQLAPHLTVFYPGDPAQMAADPVVAALLAALDPSSAQNPIEGSDNNADYAELTVRVTTDAGATLSRSLIAWVGHGALRGRYRILRWNSAPSRSIKG